MNHLIDQRITDQRKRKDIEGIRGVAVLLVLLFHAGLSFADGGFVGVDMFFVISGFLIIRHIHNDLSSKQFSYHRFLAKRMRRILPAMVVVNATKNFHQSRFSRTNIST